MMHTGPAQPEPTASSSGSLLWADAWGLLPGPCQGEAWASKACKVGVEPWRLAKLPPAPLLASSHAVQDTLPSGQTFPSSIMFSGLSADCTGQAGHSQALNHWHEVQAGAPGTATAASRAWAEVRWLPRPGVLGTASWLRLGWRGSASRGLGRSKLPRPHLIPEPWPGPAPTPEGPHLSGLYPLAMCFASPGPARTVALWSCHKCISRG